MLREVKSMPLGSESPWLEASGDFMVEKGTQEIEVLITSSSFNNHHLPPPRKKLIKMSEINSFIFYAQWWEARMIAQWVSRVGERFTIGEVGRPWRGHLSPWMGCKAVIPTSLRHRFSFTYLFVWFYLASLGLCCCVWAFSSCNALDSHCDGFSCAEHGL